MKLGHPSTCLALALVAAGCVMPITEPDPNSGPETGPAPGPEAQPADPTSTDPTHPGNQPPQVMTDADRAAAEAAIHTLLDDWHNAAATADQERYLGHFTEDAVFMGTDASERWTLEEFSTYVATYFPKGGWTYHPHHRHVAMSPGATIGWFDEQLTNEGYGELRGTGVVRRVDGMWKLAHYSMTFTVPNDIARDVVGVIREFVE